MGTRLAHISRLHSSSSQGTAQAPVQPQRHPEYLPRWVPKAGEEPDHWGGLDDATLAAVDLDVLVVPARHGQEHFKGSSESRSGCKREQPAQQTNQRALAAEQSGSTTTATAANKNCSEFLSDDALAQVDLSLIHI